MNQSILERVPLLLPPLDEQRRIAGVLGALDDLIEVNRGLVTDLRDLTRAAFDRLQGGATRSTTLGELITLQYGKALPATQRRTGRYPVVSSAGIVDSHDIGLVEGPGVVVGRKGTVGSVTWVDSNFFPIDTAFYVESKLPLLYVYWLLKSQDLASMNTDSAVPGLNRENALSLCVDRPDDEAIGEFVTSASPLWSAARDLEAEMGELASTRDELLPLLMSGRVRVAEVVVA
jgi:type I restriction enzyme S subunit